LRSRSPCCRLSETLEMRICDNFTSEISSEKIFNFSGSLDLLRGNWRKLNPISLDNFTKSKRKQSK